MKMLLWLLLMWCTASVAQSRCAPFEDSDMAEGWVIQSSVTDSTGPYLVWACATVVDGQWIVIRHCIEATWAEIDLRRLGDRSETARSSANPIAAFHASYRRHVTRSSPRCDAILAADGPPVRVRLP